MNNVFEFKKHKRPVVIAGKEYLLDCSEKAGNALDFGKSEAQRLAEDLLEGTATVNDVKAMFEGVFRAVLGDEATNELLDRCGGEMDLYDYGDLSVFLAGQFNAYHQERIAGEKK